MDLTENERSKLNFVTNFIIEKTGLEKAAKFFSGVRSGKDFLNTLNKMDFADTEPLEMPNLPFEKSEDKQKERPKEKEDEDILPLPEMKF